MTFARTPPPDDPDAPIERKAAPRPPADPLKVRHCERPFGRPNSQHLSITEGSIACRRCHVIVPRSPSATLIVLEHEPDCPTMRTEAA